jgi:hypothetical protein
LRVSCCIISRSTASVRLKQMMGNLLVRAPRARTLHRLEDPAQEADGWLARLGLPTQAAEGDGVR